MHPHGQHSLHPHHSPHHAWLIAALTITVLLATVMVATPSHAQQNDGLPRGLNAGDRRLGAHSGNMGTMRGQGIGASVDHGIGTLPGDGSGTYTGSGLGALGNPPTGDTPRQPAARVGDPIDTRR